MNWTRISSFLLLVAVTYCSAQDCDIVVEIQKVVHKGIRMAEIGLDRQDNDCGCVAAFITGDSSNCNQETFTLTDAPSCQEAIKHVDFKTKCKNHNVMAYKSMMENAIYSNGGDADEICENLSTEGDKFLQKMVELLANENNSTFEKYQKFCEADPKSCEGFNLPKTAEDYLLENLAPCIKDFVKIVKNVAKTKAMPAAGAAAQGMELMFGGGDFGLKVSKCASELMTILTNYRKQFV